MTTESIIEPTFTNYPMIDWGMLMNAMAHYTALGFSQVEVPWCVPETLNLTTKPHTNRSFVQILDMFENQPHELVGSAEQGFQYCIQQGKLQPGKYWSITPCFRFDDFDALHLPWFIKLELCHILDETRDKKTALFQMVIQCAAWFDRIGIESIIVPIGDTYDIEVNGIEVGSYGIREVADTSYIYGTGLALPRFSLANK
jgi:hypothetical protein